MKIFDEWFRPDTNFQLSAGEWDKSHLVSLIEVAENASTEVYKLLNSITNVLCWSESCYPDHN